MVTDGSLQTKFENLPSYLNPLNLAYIEELENQYKKDPKTLDGTWRSFFDGLCLNGMTLQGLMGGLSWGDLEFELKVMELVQGIRELGYLIADVDPLDRGVKQHPLLELSRFGLREEDLNRECRVSEILGLGKATLHRLTQHLKAHYCSPVAVEYAHIEEPESRTWLQDQVESGVLRKPLPIEIKKRVLQRLSEAEAFEVFLHKRFVGQKRFSVEGNDVIVPMLDYLVERSSEMGTDEVLMAMAHRGRLNVLVNVFHKDLQSLFAEFIGNLEADPGEGDVKYHIGFSQDIQTSSGNRVHLSLMTNPSHLEAVNAVLVGIARSKQKLKGDKQRIRILPVMIHGDASFSGQGSIYELLNMSELKGYSVGGTIHVILNNRIGYTTIPQEARSTPQATDVAKMLEVPIFRINADEPEPALRCMMLALEFRNLFKRDVVIDLIGYRRHGHNEADEPTYTQPAMYQVIKSHPRVRTLYADRLIREGILEEKEASERLERLSGQLDGALEAAKKRSISVQMPAFHGRWQGFHEPTAQEIFKKVPTGVSSEKLKGFARQVLTAPPGFHLHPKLAKAMGEKREMIEGKREIDWSLGETLAYASLLVEGHGVRLAGQDTVRGTFSHRHATFYDYETGVGYTPLTHLQEAKADFEVVNSSLSEYAALGFELGQSFADPNQLTIWEAQFGDFANGAQIIIDQFLVASAIKWNRYSGLVLYLPHGYEGQGAEHSSARLERFLQACAQNNIQVCDFTTPAQLFHALRRQMLREIRLPLIVMTPKSLLRHPRVVSPWSEFEEGSFQEALEDPNPNLRKTARRVVLCSGKIYYELLEAREKAGKEIALIRLEQFYPFPGERLLEILGFYRKAKEFIWCQEEPRNMGGWFFVRDYLRGKLGSHELKGVSRPYQASPADGYAHLHQAVQQEIVQNAIGGK
ncbi:MAG: 2-oxoglutarate dehydrogenase E1 component [Deltaproteobacteria bacterium]|nr:2-oxoglutarate dehydrogenase E1 component [Deltaproteobacteria bacterium]